MPVLHAMIEAGNQAGSSSTCGSSAPTRASRPTARLLCEIDGEPLFRQAGAAAALDAAITDRRLTDEVVDDHDVRKHHPMGSTCRRLRR